MSASTMLFPMAPKQLSQETAPTVMFFPLMSTKQSVLPKHGPTFVVLWRSLVSATSMREQE